MYIKFKTKIILSKLSKNNKNPYKEIWAKNKTKKTLENFFAFIIDNKDPKKRTFKKGISRKSPFIDCQFNADNPLLKEIII
jgi:hypothetical protein